MTTSKEATPPQYPKGDVAGPCLCGSWPGGPCMRCRPLTPGRNGWDELERHFARRARQPPLGFDPRLVSGAAWIAMAALVLAAMVVAVGVAVTL